MHKILEDFEIKTDHLIPVRRLAQLSISNDKKRTSYLMNFAVSLDQRVKIKEIEKTDKYLDLQQER